MTRRLTKKLQHVADKKLDKRWKLIQKAMDTTKTYDSYDITKPKKTISFSTKNMVRPFYQQKEPIQYINKLRSSKFQIPS